MRASRPTLYATSTCAVGNGLDRSGALPLQKVFGKHLFPYSILRTLRTRPCLSQPKICHGAAALQKGAAGRGPASVRGAPCCRGPTGGCGPQNTSSCWLSSGTTARRVRPDAKYWAHNSSPSGVGSAAGCPDMVAGAALLAEPQRLAKKARTGRYCAVKGGRCQHNAWPSAQSQLRAARAPDGFGQTWATWPWRPVTCQFRHSPPERHWSAAARRYRGRRGCRRQRTADPLQVHPAGQAAARGTHQDWFRSSITMEYPPIPPAGRGRR